MTRHDVVWDGREPLTESLERDYAAMRGEGWDLIWEPTSPLTTPWAELAPWASPDTEQHVATSFERVSRRRRSPRRILTELADGHIEIAQMGGYR